MTTIESWSGNVLLCTGLNCGYRGQGPHATATVLQMLGVPTAKVNLVFQYSSITVTFGNTGEYESMYVGEGFFSHYSGASKTFSCHLDETCKVNPVARKVYMLNPQTSRPAALFRCLEVMQPIQMEFITGNDNSLISQTSENTFGNRREEMPCNLIVRGKDKAYQDIGDIVPSIYIDFDKRTLISNYPEPASYELFIPDNWCGKYNSFNELIPDSHRYWMIGDKNCLEEYL